MHTEYILATSRSYNNILYERMIIIIIYIYREYITVLLLLLYELVLWILLARVRARTTRVVRDHTLSV